MTSVSETELRAEIVRTCLRMVELGINQGTSGNVSARSGEILPQVDTSMSARKDAMPLKGCDSG